MALLRQQRAIRTGTAALAVAALALVLRRFPPDRYPIYPPCPFHLLTGLQCPGCGSTRALAAMLHGHLLEAWHLNALFTLLLPCAASYLAWPLLRGRHPRPLPTPALAALLGIAFVFTIFRNLSC